MREVEITGGARVEVVDRALRNKLGDKIVGASSGGGKVRAHLTDASAIADEQTAQTVLENYGALNLSVDKTAISADGVDTATITYATTGTVDYVVYLDGQVYSTGAEPDSGGTVTLTLATEIAGVYVVHIIERTGNCGTGQVQVVAS